MAIAKNLLLGLWAISLVACRSTNSSDAKVFGAARPVVAGHVGIFTSTKAIPVSAPNIDRMRLSYQKTFGINGRFQALDHFHIKDLKQSVQLNDGDEVHFIFMGHGSKDGVQMEGDTYDESHVTYKQFGKAITELAKSANNVKISTSIIACHSGVNMCIDFPDEVFGAAALGKTVPRMLPGVFFVGLKDDYPFPATATDMYNDFEAAAQKYRPQQYAQGEYSYWTQKGGRGQTRTVAGSGPLSTAQQDALNAVAGNESTYLSGSDQDADFQELGSHSLDSIDDYGRVDPSVKSITPRDSPNAATDGSRQGDKSGTGTGDKAPTRDGGR